MSSEKRSFQVHRIASGLVEALGLAAVVLVPLAVNPWGFNYELPKVALFRALTLLMAAAHVIALAWSPTKPDSRRWLRRPLVRPVLLVGGSVLLSTVASISHLTSLWGSYHRLQGAYLLLCFILWALMIAAHLRTPAQRRRLSTTVAVAGTLVALTPFIESLRWHENPLAWRPGGSLGNPIFLGAYLVMTIPFTAAQAIAQYAPRTTQYALRNTQHPLRFVWPIALALQLFALLVTQSRGPWVGALVGLGLFAALMLWRRHRGLVLVGLAAGAISIGALLTGLNFGLAPAERVTDLPYVRRVAAVTDFTAGTVRVRLVLWRAALKVVARWPEVGLSSDRLRFLRPVLGYGLDAASIVYTHVYPPELAHIEDPGAIWDRAHNEMLDLLTMRGVLGLAAMLVLGFACARRGLALWQEAEGPVERAWIAAPLAALAAHAAEVQFAFSITTTAMMGWLCVAWLAATRTSEVLRADLPGMGESETNPSPKRQRKPDEKPRRSRDMVRWRIYAGLAALLLVLAALRIEGGLLWADVLVARARALDRAGRWERSIDLYDRALGVIPWQATWHQFRAEAFYNLARALPEEEASLKSDLLEAAERSLSRARRLEPLELEHYSNSGVLHAYWSEAVDSSHLTTAVAFYRRAFRLAPTRVRLRNDLGHVYHNHGLYEKALDQYRAALEIDPRFASAYYGAGLAWKELDRPERARGALREALSLDPDCEACREALSALEE